MSISLSVNFFKRVSGESTFTSILRLGKDSRVFDKADGRLLNVQLEPEPIKT